MKILVVGLDCAAPELLFGDERLEIDFEHAGDSERRMSFTAVGGRHGELLQAAEEAASS